MPPPPLTLLPSTELNIRVPTTSLACPRPPSLPTSTAQLGRGENCSVDCWRENVTRSGAPGTHQTQAATEGTARTHTHTLTHTHRHIQRRVLIDGSSCTQTFPRQRGAQMGRSSLGSSLGAPQRAATWLTDAGLLRQEWSLASLYRRPKSFHLSGHILTKGSLPHSLHLAASHTHVHALHSTLSSSLYSLSPSPFLPCLPTEHPLAVIPPRLNNSNA